MKRMFLLLLALMLLASAAVAEGNRLLSLEGAEYGGYISGMFTDGETLYIVSDMKLLTWKAGEEAPTAWDAGDMHLPTEDGGEEYVGIYEFRMYADGEGLHAVRLGHDADYQPDSLRLYDMTLSDGAITAKETARVALPDAMRSEFYPNAAYVQDGVIYLLGDNETGSVVAAIDMENPKQGRTTQLSGYQSRLMPTREGVLVTDQDYMNERHSVCRIGEDAGLDEVCALPMEAAGVAADPETGAVYAAIDGRVRRVDAATGEAGEAVGVLPVQPENAVIMGRSYAAILGGSVAVLDLDGQVDESAVLTIESGGYDDWLNRAVVAYSVEHPELPPVLGHDAYNVLDGMMTQSPDTDIYVVSGYDGASYEALLNRGYMLPLDGSEKLANLAGRVYPRLREKLTRDGVLVALPLGLNGSGMGMSKALLEKMGIAVDDIPRDWPGFLDFMEESLKPALDQLGEKDRFSYDDMNAQDFRAFLCRQMLGDFEQASGAAGVIPNYEDPRLLAAMERLEQIDFTEYGLPDKNEGDEGMGYGWSSENHYLIQFDAGFMFSDMNMIDSQPLALGFGDDLPGVLAVRLSAAFINPYSKHGEQAVAFLETLADRLPDEVLYALCPDLNEPVRNPGAEKEAAWFETQLEQWKKLLDEAAPEDRQMLQEQLDSLTGDYEDYLQNRSWLISAEQLAWYRANAESMVVATPSWFERDSSGEAYQLMQQYDDGQLSVREFLAAVNKKARMMAMEAG